MRRLLEVAPSSGSYRLVTSLFRLALAIRFRMLRKVVTDWKPCMRVKAMICSLMAAWSVPSKLRPCTESWRSCRMGEKIRLETMG